MHFSVAVIGFTVWVRNAYSLCEIGHKDIRRYNSAEYGSYHCRSTGGR